MVSFKGVQIGWGHTSSFCKYTCMSISDTDLQLVIYSPFVNMYISDSDQGCYNFSATLNEIAESTNPPRPQTDGKSGLQLGIIMSSV